MQNLSHYIINDILSSDQIEPLDILNLATTCKQFSNLAKEEICANKYVLPHESYSFIGIDGNTILFVEGSSFISYNIKTGNIKTIDRSIYRSDDKQKILYNNIYHNYNSNGVVYDYKLNILREICDSGYSLDVSSNTLYKNTGTIEYVQNGYIISTKGKLITIRKLPTLEIISTFVFEYTFNNTFSSDLKYIGSCVGLFEISNGKLIYGFDNSRYSHIFTADSRFFISTYENSIYIFDIINEKEHNIKTDSHVYQISVNGKNILLYKTNKGLTLLDVETRKILI